MTTWDRRQVLRAFGMLAAAGVTGGASAACSSGSGAAPAGAANGQSVTIGLIAAAVGPYAKVGDHITKGFRLYLSDHDNLLGGFGVNLVVRDEGSAPTDAAAAARVLVKEAGVVAVAGLANPAAFAAAAPVVAAAGVPLIGANGAPLAAGGAGVWRAAYVDGEAGRAVAGFAHRTGPTAYVLLDGSVPGRAEADAFSRAFAAMGGRVVGTAIGPADLGSALGTAIAAGPSSIFAAHTGDSALALLQAYREAQPAMPLIGPGTLTETVDLAAFGPLPRGVFTAMYYATDLDNDDNRRFVASYQKAWSDQPTSCAMAAYDAALVLDRALRRIDGAPTPGQVRDQLAQLGQINSPRGSWRFNADRTPQQNWYLRRLRLDGQVAANMLDSDLAVLG